MSNRKRLKRPAAGTTLGERTTKRLHDIQSTFSGRYNGYICERCDKGYLTLDIDHGTTPGITTCYATEGCDGQAISLGYPEGEPPLELGEPIIHWYKPNATELEKMQQSEPWMANYVEGGGLLRKATEHAPDWVKAELAA